MDQIDLLDCIEILIGKWPMKCKIAINAGGKMIDVYATIFPTSVSVQCLETALVDVRAYFN